MFLRTNQDLVFTHFNNTLSLAYFKLNFQNLNILNQKSQMDILNQKSKLRSHGRQRFPSTNVRFAFREWYNASWDLSKTESFLISARILAEIRNDSLVLRSGGCVPPALGSEKIWFVQQDSPHSYECVVGVMRINPINICYPLIGLISEN